MQEPDARQRPDQEWNHEANLYPRIEAGVGARLLPFDHSAHKHNGDRTIATRANLNSPIVVACRLPRAPAATDWAAQAA